MIFSIIHEGGIKKPESVIGRVEDLRGSERRCVCAAGSEQDPSILKQGCSMLIAGNLHIAERSELVRDRIQNLRTLQRLVAGDTAGDKDVAAQ